MAQMVSIRLSKGEAPSLGFRIQGGKDFGTPLIVQKVNFGSPAEKAGLQAGDSVIKINNVDVYNLRHKDAQDVIIRAGPAFEITVQRGGSTWKPTVTPITPTLPKPQPASNSYSPVTKTSLAVSPQTNIGAIGTGHNVSAKPFGAQNGTVNGGPKFVNKQYNSPLGLYSEQSIAETLSAQAEVLSTGALGVNFKKNEKDYDASNSEVFRMVQEADKEPKQQESEPDSGVVTSPLTAVMGLRHVSAPETKPKPPSPQLPPGQNICAECERLVTGVFVRIKDKNLHVECFKCATCGTSLKNVGYYNINNKLYCDVHAKLAARSNPPAPNVMPVTIPPGGRVPTGTISAALSSHPLPATAAPLSPNTNPNQTAQPFLQNPDLTDEVSLTMASNVHEQEEERSFASEKPIGNVPKYMPTRNEGPIPFSAYMSKSGTNFSSPRPFSSVSAPLSPPSNTGYSTLPKPAPPAAAPPSLPYSSPAPSIPSSEKGRTLQNIIWPPPPHPEEADVPTATPLYFPPSTHLRIPTPSTAFKPPEPRPIQPPLPKPLYPSQFSTPSKEIQETITKTTEEVVYREETVREETTNYSESVVTEEEEFHEAEDMSFEPRMSLCSAEVTSIVDRKVAVETIESAAGSQMLVESLVKQRPRSPPPVPAVDEDILPKVEVQTQRPRSNTEPRVLTRVCVCTNSCCNATTGELCESCPMRDLKRPNDFQKPKPIPVQNSVPKRFGSPIITGVSVTINNPGKIRESKDFFTDIPVKKTTTALGSALVTAPKEPFHPVTTSSDPVPLPEETEPYFPPERPYVPPEKPKVERKESIPQPETPLVSALRIAPERPWTPTNPPPLVTKKKTPSGRDDPIMKDLPKPVQWMSMVSALTTAPDRPYSPFVGEVSSSVSQEVIEQTEIKQEEIIKMKQSQQEIMSRSVHNETALPKPYVGTTTKTTRLEKFDAVNDDRVTPQMHFPPVSDELKSAYEYHADYSEIKSEISSQIVEQAHLEEISEVKSTQIVDEKRQEEMKCTSCKKMEAKAVAKEERKIEKQTEETVLKKPTEYTSYLQKREYLPQYQMSLNYDETIELPHHKNIKKLLPSDQGKKDPKNANTKPSSYQYTPKPLPTYQESQTASKPVTKPVSTIQPGQANPNVPKMSFQTIEDEKPARTSFSPRPGSLTPSMINKPAPTLPYYQSNLVYTEMPVLEVNVFDPKSPEISRSPSPCPDRAPSPFGRMSPRPKSPAAGPPPNPLKQGVIPKFTKEDHLRGEAAKNISTYIPQYMEKIDGRVSDSASKSVTQHVSFNVPLKKTQLQEAQCVKKSAYETQAKKADCEASCTMKVCQKRDAGVCQKSQVSVQESVQQTVQEIVQESVQQSVQKCSMKQSSMQTSAQQHQAKISAIEQQATTKQASLEATKQVLKPTTEPPFRQVKNPEVDPPSVQGMRLTNPQRISSPFIQKTPPQQPPAPPVRSSVPKTPISAATAQPKPSQQSEGVLTNKNAQCGASNVSNVPQPNAGVGGGKQAGAVGFSPKRGRGVLNVGGLVGSRIAVCGHCHEHAKTNTEIITNGKPQNGFYNETSSSLSTSPIPNPKSPTSTIPRSTTRQNTLDIREFILASSKMPTPPTLNGPIQNPPNLTEPQPMNNLNGPIMKSSYDICDDVNQLSKDIEKISVTNSEKNVTNRYYEPIHATVQHDNSNKRRNSLKSNGRITQIENGNNRNVGNQNYETKKEINGFKSPPLVLQNVLKTKVNNNIPDEKIDVNIPTKQVEKSVPNTAVITPSNNQTLTPICCVCNQEIVRGPFITALGKIWCPEHFICTTQNCRRPLADIGFIEEQGQLYCEYCFEQYLAPPCSKCGIKIKGDCLKAIGKTFHPECFNCAYCGKLFGNSPFFLEDGQPYCENDWNEMFTTKCFACGFPVEAGDRWVEALNNNYHSQCFNCTMCKKNLEGQSFFAKGGRPFCKNHAR